jgi:hypothetical protein
LTGILEDPAFLNPAKEGLMYFPNFIAAKK